MQKSFAETEHTLLQVGEMSFGKNNPSYKTVCKIGLELNIGSGIVPGAAAGEVKMLPAWPARAGQQLIC